MVSPERPSEEPTKSNNDEEIRIEEWTQDGRSISENSNRSDEDVVSEAELDDCCNSFDDVVVKNSSKVQFGDNNIFHAPVTITQFVHKGAEENHSSIENGRSVDNNITFLPESVIDKSQDCDKSDKKDGSSCEKNGNITTKSTKDGKWDYLYKKRIFYAIFLSILLVVSIVLLTTILVTKYQYGSVYDELSEDSKEQDSNVNTSGKLKIISRQGWSGQLPVDVTPLDHPVPFVIILHTATEGCSDQTTCISNVRFIQYFHMESKDWWDIAYNFLVGGDGFAYEGRGWQDQGANVFGYNNRSIGIAFIGTFNKIEPTARQILACKQLIERGVEDGYIAKDYKLFAHRQLAPTQSPGEVLYENIKTWPHWTKSP